MHVCTGAGNSLAVLMLKVMKMVEAMLTLRVEEARAVNQSNADDWDVDHEGKDLCLKVTALKCFQ